MLINNTSKQYISGSKTINITIKTKQHEKANISLLLKASFESILQIYRKNHQPF